MLIYKDIEKRLLSCDHREQSNPETKLETINPEQGCFSLWAAVITENNETIPAIRNKAVECGAAVLVGYV